MVDIHCHILWGVDDGARTLEESIGMARLAAESGTTDIVATPHCNDRYPYEPVVIRERLAELRRECGERPRIHLGSDFHLSFPNIEAALQDARPFTINRSRYLMVELPDTIIPSGIGKVFERMVEQGIFPVITHPERNRAIWRDERQFEIWLGAGCYVQITAQSLEGVFGKTAKDVAWRLLENDQVHFVASDGHDLEYRPPRMDIAFSSVAEKYGDEFALRLFRDNPRTAIEGNDLPDSKAVKKKAKTLFRLF
jgi:protein-tyrosine phosphatase